MLEPVIELKSVKIKGKIEVRSKISDLEGWQSGRLQRFETAQIAFSDSGVRIPHLILTDCYRVTACNTNMGPE